MSEARRHRVAAIALFVACAANVLLWTLAGPDEWFADVIAVASGIAAVALVVTGVVPVLRRLREPTLLLAFAVWSANALEFGLSEGPRWESQVRQCGLYLALALLALGTYVAVRVDREAAA